MTVADQNPPRIAAAITKMRYKNPIVARLSRKWKASQVQAATTAREMLIQGRAPSVAAASVRPAVFLKNSVRVLFSNLSHARPAPGRRLYLWFLQAALPITPLQQSLCRPCVVFMRFL